MASYDFNGILSRFGVKVKGERKARKGSEEKPNLAPWRPNRDMAAPVCWLPPRCCYLRLPLTMTITNDERTMSGWQLLERWINSTPVNFNRLVKP